MVKSCKKKNIGTFTEFCWRILRGSTRSVLSSLGGLSKEKTFFKNERLPVSYITLFIADREERESLT